MPKGTSIVPLSNAHKKETFDCGEGILNDYLKAYASQDSKRNLAQHFVATSSQGKEVLGYYSLSAGSEDLLLLPEEMRKRLPKYPVPLVRLSRLAIDLNHQGQGLGKHLLLDALYRSLRAADSIGIHAFIVDAKHTKAQKFYTKFGFTEFPDNPLTLILPMKTIRKAFLG